MPDSEDRNDEKAAGGAAQASDAKAAAAKGPSRSPPPSVLPPANPASPAAGPVVAPPATVAAAGATHTPVDSDVLDAARSTGLSAARVVLERPNARAPKGARRDVHRKHHGCVWGWLKVNSQLAPELRQGVFSQPGKLFSVWIRFSNSNKRAQWDTVGDGRGVAIKLLGVDAVPRLVEGQQQTTQDFLFLNGPAFFAADADAMSVAARLEAEDKFPSNFFISKGNLSGLAALLHMAQATAASPLDITYYSQAPYKLGANQMVKHRLRPLRPVPRREKTFKGANFLFAALRDDLAPANDAPPADTYEPQPGEVKFEFAVQFRGEPKALYPDDDATVVWDEANSPFVPVAELIIPPQRFNTKARMTFAEDMSFNPWNGLQAHEPVGSLGIARRFAYNASLSARHGLNGVKTEPDYSVAEWRKRRTPDPKDELWTPPEIEHGTGFMQALSGFAALLPGPASWPARVFSSPWGYVVAPLLLVAFLVAGYLTHPPWFCAPLRLGVDMPSERMIPPAVLSPERVRLGYDERGRRERDPVWTFRYGAVGAEGNGGLPYWIFRVLPSMFPGYFGKRGDWSEFGLQASDDTDYYKSYHGLPRGVILTEPIASFGGNQLQVGLQLVTFNCASCHRGEYLDRDGHPQFVDGMPNLGIDTAGYKRAVFSAVTDKNFTAENVIAKIDELLAKEHADHPLLDGRPTPSKLNAIERGAYALIVKYAIDQANKKPLQWLKDRPDNGPGRLDAFGALRFEFLGYDNEPNTIATVDLPSIWHQQPAWRPWHHWDGNTDQVRARNFGAIIGIGGRPETLKKAEILTIGRWIDQELVPGLKPPPFPFFTSEHAPGSETYKKGKQVFESSCARCHGHYDEQGTLQDAPLPPCMQRGEPSVDTDEHRYQAIDADFVGKLNTFGTDVSTWGPTAFRPTQGYLCPPLDGIWARAPYLHNGSVPTLWDLLGPVDKRPPTFERGNPKYDVEKGGFVSKTPPTDRRQFTFDTTRPGNSSKGHGFEIPEEDRKAVITYLQTL